MSKSIFDTLSPQEKRTQKIMVSISIMISDERKRRGMTQKELADCLGVNQAMVSRWESGQYNFSIQKVVEIFDKLDLKLNFELPKIELPKRKAAAKFDCDEIRKFMSRQIHNSLVNSGYAA